MYIEAQRNSLLDEPLQERSHLVNFWLWVEAATLVNMWFKKKEKQPQEDEVAPSAPMDGEATDESKAKDLKRIDTDIIYPSGLKLALLIMSIFVGMFLVSLVRERPASVSPLR